MTTDSEYNGPTKDDFFDHLADYEEARFNMQRAASRAGKVLEAWEKNGGNKADIRDGYAYRQLDVTEQQAELRRQMRVASWFGLVAEDVKGQANFNGLFDAPPPSVPSGIGGAPAGSRLAVVRAMAAGFNDGKAKNGPGLQDGIELYGWEADSDEAFAYAEGYGDGFKLRPAPKPRKTKADDDDDDGETIPRVGIDAQLARIVELDGQAEAEKPKRGRGRPPKNAAQPATAAATNGQGKQPLALPAPDGWGDDGVDQTPPGPMH